MAWALLIEGLGCPLSGLAALPPFCEGLVPTFACLVMASPNPWWGRKMGCRKKVSCARQHNCWGLGKRCDGRCDGCAGGWQSLNNEPRWLSYM